MRKVIEYCLVSADGIVLNDPFPFRDYDDDAYLRDRLGTFAACDAILWGRTTYERFAKRSPGGERIPHMPRVSMRSESMFFRRSWRQPSGITRPSFVARLQRR